MPVLIDEVIAGAETRTPRGRRIGACRQKQEDEHQDAHGAPRIPRGSADRASLSGMSITFDRTRARRLHGDVLMAPRTDIADSENCFAIVHTKGRVIGRMQVFTDGTVGYWRDDAEQARLAADPDAALTRLMADHETESPTAADLTTLADPPDDQR